MLPERSSHFRSVEYQKLEALSEARGRAALRVANDSLHDTSRQRRGVESPNHSALSYYFLKLHVKC